MRLSFFAQVGISLLVATMLVASAPLVNAVGPDFNISANPLARCIDIGSSATYSITVSSSSGFSGQVRLDDSVYPSVSSGPSLSPIPSSVTVTPGQNATFDLSASTTSSTPNQAYTITVDGLTDTTVQSVSVSLAFAPLCGSVGAVISPVNGLSLATPFIGFAVIISAIAGVVALAFLRIKRKTAQA